LTMSHGWGYAADNGPGRWCENFPIADGPRQSPIDIKAGEAEHDAHLQPLRLRYDPAASIDLLNNGHSVQVTFADDSDITVVTGPISGTYRLKQFHFHWGACDARGSEHTVDGTEYAAELHLVHWNTKYGSFAEAASQSDGLAVVGVFLQVSVMSGFLTVIDAFNSIKEKVRSDDLPNLTPASSCPHRWTTGPTDGSLTTPPLLESVTWIVCREPISVSSAQMEKFRILLFSAEGEEPCCMSDNYRPPQELKGRRVRASFK
uniref:Carbonic anhydrase n=1 Tax=Denticeps clupeoides TaxID=299321 RepID=A0AAY3ZZR4_9TELE